MVAAATPVDKIRDRNAAVNVALADLEVQQKIDAVGGQNHWRNAGFVSGVFRQGGRNVSTDRNRSENFDIGN